MRDRCAPHLPQPSTPVSRCRRTVLRPGCAARRVEHASARPAKWFVDQRRPGAYADDLAVVGAQAGVTGLAQELHTATPSTACR